MRTASVLTTISHHFRADYEDRYAATVGDKEVTGVQAIPTSQSVKQINHTKHQGVSLQYSVHPHPPTILRL
ncbi:hypothetical protein UPYG_G00289080 [Umbra pygmaea]|uniref:Uncharacterized protein n=1 Tax=Umbra pygmaea TaxID=75934 RepID=A0ABD0W504_UMBPY